MAKKKTPPPRALSTFDDLDAAGIGAGYVSPFTPGDAPAADEPPKSRGLLAVANDTVIEAANAAAGGFSSAANFIKPGNAVSGWIDKNIIQAGEESQSDVVKASKKKFREGVANADGVMGELGAVGGYIVENPLLAAAQAAGSFVGPGAAVKGAGMAARAAGLGAKGIERAGRAGGVAAGAAMAGGDAAGTAYDLAIKAGATEEEATAAARQASVIPALVGGVGGAFGAESLLAGAKGFGGGAAARAAKTGLSEAAQEAVEEGVTQYEGQRAAVPFDPSIDPSKGVAAAAGMGAALGGMTGAGTSLLTGGHGAVNPLDEAINLRAAESGALSQPLALPAPTITVDGTGVARTADDRNTVLQRSADGSFVDMTEVPGQASLTDPEMLALPAPVIQVDGAGNAITSEDRNAQAQQDLEARAARRQRLDSGDILDVTPVPHAPGFVPLEPAPAPVVPERGALSRAANLGAAATQQAAPAMLALGTQNNERPEVAAQGVDAETGEISPEERAGQIQEHLNFLSLMGRNQGWTNEALAQRTALQQELDLLSPAQRMADLQDQATEADARAADWAGRQYRPNATELPEHAAKGGPADIQEANEQRRLKNIQQAQQEAAAARAQVDQVEGEGNAQAQLAAQQDRAARVAQAAPDILNKQGKPFTVKLPAVKAAQAAGAGWEPVKVEGGYVVRQVQPTDSPAPAVPKVPAPTAQAAMAKAEEIAREGNAQRQQVAQADQDAGARWDAMQPDAQRSVLAAVPKMAKVIRQNLEGKAWEKMSAGNREKVLGAMNSVAATEQQQKNSEEKPIEGKDLGNGWAAFAPESGTKSVPRAQMPQIKAEHRGAMVNFMNARGIAHQEETVPAASLKPTQAEFSREKVKKALGYEGGDRSILVSQDGHVLDGHHQWMAAREQGKDVKTIRLDAPIDQLLEAAHEFPSSSTSGGAVDSKAAGAERSDAAFTPSVGMAVEITNGLYAGNSGTVESVSDTGRVVVRGNNELATGFATTARDLAPSTQQAATSGQFPLAEADRSYSGISRSGSQRAKGDRDAFEQFMTRAEQSGAAVATTEAQRQAASAALEALRTDYLAQYRSLMNTRAGAYSGFVAGRGNLNSKQANSRNSALDKAMQRFDTWVGENADRVHKAVLAARTPEQVKADRDAATAQIQEKADKKAANLKATLLKFLSFKSGESMPYGKNAILTKVSYDRDGYPSSLTFKMADGSPLTDDKVELVATLKDRGETLAQAKARIRALVDEVRAENPQLNGGAGAIRAAASDKAAKPKSVPAKIAEAEAARSGYFTPGNIVKSYGGHDRVIAYTAPDADGHWSVKVQAVRKEGDAWVNEPNEGERTHSTPPDARQLKAGPVQAVNSDSEQAASFRRSSADEGAGADFDVEGFLQAMNDGQPVAQARAEDVSAVQKTVDAIRAGWANGPEVTVVYDMADPAIPAAARRADQAQRSGGADGDPEGFYYGGKAYLLASQLHTDKDVARVLMHEALGHHGLRGVFGTGLDSVLEQIVAVRRGDVRRKAAEYGLDYDKPAHRLQAAEEVLAEWAQTRPEMGFVRRAVAAIRSWLRQHVPGFKGMRVTDDELIRAYILPARGWVERGAGAGMARDIAFSRTSATSMPDAIIGSTLGSASSHPDYAAAKGGDIEAAVRLAKDLVTPELLAKVKALIGDSKPLVVPVAAEEAAGRNKIPRASAEVLALRLGLDTAFDIVQANRARRTGMDGLDRLFAPVDFEGAVEPGSYLLLDDTLTQGGTFAALASHIREGGGTVAGVIALTGKQYSAKIQPSAETLASLRQKHGDLENEFRAATGYGFDSLTESEARYLARYEPADRLRDRISEEGRRGRARQDQGDSGPGAVSDGPLFSRSRLADIKGSALSQLDNILSHPGKVSMWDKTVGTMRHLAERNPFFKPVYESAQQNIDDVSMLANDAADQAPRILPRVDSMGDILGKNRKRPVSAADNKAVAHPLFEGTLMWGRDINGQAVLVEDLAKKYANLSAHNKAAMLLKANRIDAGVLAMWQGLPAQQYENMINSRFESKILKAGVVWSDKELQSQFGATPDQISLYREARAAIDRSIDMTARADMMRTLGDGYAAMRDAVLEQPSLDSAGQLLLDMLEQDAKAVPDNRDRLAIQMQQIRKRLEDAKALQESGYAPLSRFGRYTVDVVDAAGERQYFGMYETIREANTAARNFRLTFPDAKVEQGTMSQQAYKLFAGVTPESLELFGNMLGLDSEGNEAKDKAFQEYLKLTKNNHSALKRMIHRKGTAGFSEDVGRVVANFVYSNARQAAAGLNVGALDKAINAIPKDQGELKDLAMGLRSYIQDPQEEGQAVRGMLFAQYLGGSLASAFVNMTQPFQVTLPWLSQYGGMKKAGAQLTRALKDMGTKGFQYEADLAKALQSAEDDGVVSPQEIHQLMSQARGAGALRAGDGTAAGNARATAANAWERTKVAWGQPFALAEQFNRRSTFIASYRLAKEQGIQNPSAFARKAVLDTQFVYSKAVKPQWARGTIGGTLFTFKTYSVSYLELMQRMWTQGAKGSPERAAGRRAVGWSIAMLMLMGGAGGLPFAEDIEDLIDAGGQLMGYSMSVKQWRKQLMQDVLGKELADFIEQGVSGLPGAPVDISGRLGMGNLIPGTGLFLEKRDHSRDMLEIIGPAGDLIQRAATGARKALTGDIAGAALEVSPTAVRNLAKGVDMADSGIYKDSKGRKVIDVTLGEAVAKAVGFQPKSVAETQEATATEQNLIGQNRAMKERLTADMAQAVYDKDVERQAEIRERQQAWNRRNPESSVFIDRRSVRQRVIKMRQTKAERVAAAAPKSIRANVRQSLAEAQGGTTAP
ncbi:PLxRFG domain-containing protein [Comamonas sp.]|uniref:PLxRFG domain-containing protein n=1 Tax=Comamonas sp. TaxID=34028 RepID=UPI0012C06C39|nr:PLxRFG domain-containing protein [Comamonas sp.]MPT10941.1 PLxRFG domain-containing protein [Comamonas sp.]